jgi:hypothetical protein
MAIPRTYKQQFKKAKERLAGRIADSKGEIALWAFSEIVRLTPVDTGLARGNWNLSFDKPDGTRQRPAPTGQAAIQRARQLLGANRRGVGTKKQVVIANSLPYIRRLEYGWSQQAPQGMVRITLAKLPKQARDILTTKLTEKEF